MKMIFFALFISIFYIAGFYMLKQAYDGYNKSQTALDWPTTTAQIISSELVTYHDSEGANTYEVQTTYKYSLNGKSYQNDRIAFGYTSSSTKTAHQKILDKLHKAKKVRINYEPENPQNSVIAPGLNKSTIITFIFGINLLIFLLGFTILWVLLSQEDSRLLDNIRIEQAY